jgi:hypothetical protein
VADKLTSCMKKAGWLAHVDCHLAEARDEARAGHRGKALVHLNRAEDAARMSKVGTIRGAVQNAKSSVVDIKSTKSDMAKAITKAEKLTVEANRATFRKCGAQVDF